jgi:hypothetical protein
LPICVASKEYNVVVFPDPVGPHTIIIPWGRSIDASSDLKLVPRSPSSANVGIPPDFWRSLITIFSPYAVGRTLTRRSTSSCPTLKLNLPSCGILFSSIFIPDKIFILEIKDACFGKNTAT